MIPGKAFLIQIGIAEHIANIGNSDLKRRNISLDCVHQFRQFLFPSLYRILVLAEM